MKAFLTALILISVARPAMAWERLCTFEGPGLSKKVSFLTYDVYRESAGHGKFNYLIKIPVGIGNPCGIGQYAEGKVSAKIWMTKNIVFDTGTFKRYKGNHDLEEKIENQPYAECIAGDYSTSHSCKF